jgi:glucoamylase
MLPEQVWDTEDMPEKELFFGRPSGSAMPLVWAHGEYIKLCRSLQDGAIFDMPSATKKRYLIDKTVATHALWRFEDAIKTMEKGKILRIEAEHAFKLHWSAFNWSVLKDTDSTPSVFGTHYVDIPTADLKESTKLDFTFFWTDSEIWENRDFTVVLS